MRSLSATTTLALLCSSAVAIAGHDHHHAPVATAPATTVEATVAAEGAVIDGGAYQGLAPALAIHHGRFGGQVAAPVYRLERGDPIVGLGDVALQVDAGLVSAPRWRGGAVLMVTLPTGSADDSLGMGHVMAMPALWIVASDGRARLSGSISLSRALGSDEHAHHRPDGVSPGPVVNPMNFFEVGGAVRVGYAATRTIEIALTGTAATPIGDGVARATVGAGAQRQTASWTLRSEVMLGVVGDPFKVRLVVAGARRF